MDELRFEQSEKQYFDFVTMFLAANDNADPKARQDFLAQIKPKPRPGAPRLLASGKPLEWDYAALEQYRA